MSITCMPVKGFMDLLHSHIVRIGPVGTPVVQMRKLRLSQGVGWRAIPKGMEQESDRSCIWSGRMLSMLGVSSPLG